MSTFQVAVSNAVRTQAARKKLTFTDVASSMGISRESLARRLANKQSWDANDFEPLARSLGLKNVWEFMELAKNEQRLAA